MYRTQAEISTNNATYYACLYYKMNFWLQIFIGEINIFEVSGVDSSKRHYNSAINIFWFIFKCQNTAKYCYLISEIYFSSCVCVCVCVRVHACMHAVF